MDLKAAQAKLEIYNQEVEDEKTLSNDCSSSNGSKSDLSKGECHETKKLTVKASATDIPLLFQAFQDDMSMSKLSVPEPPVFTNNPHSFH